MQNLLEYITENWTNTIRLNSKTGEPLPKPFTVPCISEAFENFYYWDTYFTNLGLLNTSNKEQVYNNLDDMAYLIKKFGFMPNANHLTDRSQPPLFCRAVYDLYIAENDEKVIKRYVDYIILELKFWEDKRKLSCGLSTYGYYDDEKFVRQFYNDISGRLGIKVNDCRETSLKNGSRLLAMAESGWDFNSRYKTEQSDFDILNFAQLDLNCILYDAEYKCFLMCDKIGKTEKALYFKKRFEERKALINKYMRNEDGTYNDYNFVLGKTNKVISIACLMPYCFNISNDKLSAQKTLSKLETEHGISSTEKLNGKTYQWDYPNMWPPLVYFAIEAFVVIGDAETAERLSLKYVATVEKIFKATGKLWEKYDAEVGNISCASEYATPPMMGWTAGVYVWCKKLLNKMVA